MVLHGHVPVFSPFESKCLRSFESKASSPPPHTFHRQEPTVNKNRRDAVTFCSSDVDVITDEVLLLFNAKIAPGGQFLSF